MEIPTSEQSLQATSTSFLEQAQQTAYGLLTHFANQSNALQQLTTSFGNTFEAQLATAILAQWQEQDFNHLPDVEVLPGKALRGANGGFAASTNRIYISEQFIHQAEQFDYLTGLTHVLLEETGHAVDALLNVKDTPGDEGNIFARLVQGHRLDPAEINQLSIEDDFSWISLNGQEVLLEMSYPSIVSDQASDFNGDGKSDIFWRHSDGSVAAWLMDGTQTLAMSLLGSGPVEQAWQVESIADFNGDGKSDIFWRHSDGSVATWLMNGTQTLAMSLLGSGPVEQAWQVMDIADFNGDGKSDIFWRHSDGSVATWLMNGTQTLAMSLLGSGPVEQAWQVESIADFNGDGKSDIFWRHSDGSVATWLMNGTQTLAMSLLGSGPVEQAWQVEDVADFNGDGKSDIFWRYSDGSVAAWLMNGTQTLAMSLLGNTPVAQGWQPWPFQTQFILPPSPPPVNPPPPEQSGSVTVTAPNGGSALQIGSTYDITWTDNLSGNVRIYLYALQPPGSLPGVPSNQAPTPYPYRMIADSTPSDGSYSWTVPFDLPADYSYQIHISSLANLAIFDTSDDFFTLTTDLKKYWFVYDFNPDNYQAADSYKGSVIAPAGMYSVTPLDGDYSDSDYFDPNPSSTETGVNGKYLVYAVEDYDDSLLNESGRVFVHSYIDRDNGAEVHIVPYNYRFGAVGSTGFDPASYAPMASGYAYLGSEFDFIDDASDYGNRFGKDFYEADPAISGWTAEYFTNPDLSGNPDHRELLRNGLFTHILDVSVGNESRLKFSQNWGENSPTTHLGDPAIPADNFSARYTRQQNLAPGLYRVHTYSDDGIRVKVGNQTVISDWEVQPETIDGGFYGRASGYEDPVSGYFSPPSPSPGGGFIGGYMNPVEGYSKVPTANIGYFYWEGGEAPITVEYFEATGEAKLSFALSPVVNKLPHQGQTVVYTWSPESGQPSLEMLQTGIAHPQAITDGVILDYTRPDGKPGILANWEDLSPFPTVPKDFFAIQSYVETYLDDREYEFTIRADDGYQILAQQQSTGEWFYITPQNTWEQAYDAPKVYSWTPDESGMYDLYFHYYENSGDAYIDLSWEAVKFEDPVAPGEWNTIVYNWEQSGRPSADMLKTGMPHPEALGRISLGNATRADGKPGIDALWTDSPNNDSRLPADNFAIQSHTQTYFDGSEYAFSVLADDGYQLLARQQGSDQWFYITPQNQWQTGLTSPVEYLYQLPTGNYDLHFHMYETTGDAAIELSWEKVVSDPDAGGGQTGGSGGNGEEIIPLGEMTVWPSLKFINSSLNQDNSLDSYTFTADHRIDLEVALSSFSDYLISDEISLYLRNEDGVIFDKNTSSRYQNSTLFFEWKLEPGEYTLQVHGNDLSDGFTYDLELIPTDALYFYEGAVTRGEDIHPISLKRVSEPGGNKPVSISKETWLIIHGWNSSPSGANIDYLAKSIELYDPDDQVFVLDWSSASNTGPNLGEAASWIEPVAEWTANMLNNYWQIPGEKINLVGHSLGAYVTAEIAERILSGVNHIIAFDPAAEIPGGYVSRYVDFSEHSIWSWAFLTSELGSSERVITADDAFSIEFKEDNPFLNNSKAKHGNGLNLFAYMLNKDSNDWISDSFKLDQIGTRKWKVDRYNQFGDSLLGGSYEGRLETKLENGEWIPYKFNYEPIDIYV